MLKKGKKKKKKKKKIKKNLNLKRYKLKRSNRSIHRFTWVQAYTSASVLHQRISCIQIKRQKTKKISQSASIKHQINLPFGYETRQDNPLSGASMNARVRNESHTRSTNEIESRRTRPSREPRFIERDETRTTNEIAWATTRDTSWAPEHPWRVYQPWIPK